MTAPAPSSSGLGLVQQTVATGRRNADEDDSARSRARRWATATGASIVLIAAVTGAIALLNGHAPVRSLDVLYLLAVVPVAVVWGMVFATAVSVVSVTVFGVLFLPPKRQFSFAESGDYYTLFVFLVASVVVSVLATRSQRAARASARLAEEQGALRQVATLVAQETTTRAQLDALICEEVGRMLRADLAVMRHFEPDGGRRLMGQWTRSAERAEIMSPLVAEVTETIARTGRPALIHADIRDGSGVGAPIVVEDALWGAIVVVSKDGRLPRNAAERLADFTALVAIAIANAKNRAELAASRKRLVVAADEARRRIERDLHDGAQQQLVALAIDLQGIEEAVPDGLPQLRADLVRVRHRLIETVDEIREIARGIHPAVLAEGGLPPALKMLGRRCPIPVTLDIDVDERLADQVEVAAYYVVAESLTNAVKHAEASLIEVTGEASDGVLRIRVRDDGRGGASPTRGSGLVGIMDRVEALGGRLGLESPPGAGTVVQLELPATPSGGATRDG